MDPVDILSPLEKSGFWDGVVSAPASCFHFFSILDYLTYFYHFLNMSVLLPTANV